jgi:hypothetical protein
MEEIKELNLNPELKMQYLIEQSKKSLSQISPNAQIKLVGYQLHFLIDDNLASIGGYSDGFNLSDFES